jgi:hypothetical protein
VDELLTAMRDRREADIGGSRPAAESIARPCSGQRIDALKDALDKNPAIIGIDKGRPGGDKTVEVHAHRDANGGIVIDKMIESEPRDALTEEIPLPDFAILQRRPMLLAVLDEASELLRGFPPGEMRDMRRRIDHEAAMIRALPASQMEPCEEKR